jgi:hypothetical protein
MSTTRMPSGSCWWEDNPEHPHAGVAGCGVRAGGGQATGRPAGVALHPKHGSWLNMAELELAVLAGQCLDRRLADQAMLQREVAAWQAARNADGRGVNWRFTTEDARIKLQHLYPTTHELLASAFHEGVVAVVSAAGRGCERPSGRLCWLTGHGGGAAAPGRGGSARLAGMPSDPRPGWWSGSSARLVAG